MLDEQRGLPAKTKHKIGAAPRKNIGFKLSESSADRSDKIVNYETSGDQGASRFFFTAKNDIRHSCESVNIAQNDLSPLFKLDDFVLRLVAIVEVLEDKQLRDLTILFTTDIQSKLKSSVEPSMPLILSTVEKFLHELKHIESSSQNHAKHVELQNLIDTTMTIVNLLTFDGYAENVTLTNTPSRLALGARVFANRFLYCAKISTSERNAGLENEPDKLGSTAFTGEGGGAMLTGSGNTRRITNKNSHPTVKPKKLMKYLINLITPPNGVVLDPFMGSGSTGLAAKELGFEFVGIEKEQEYFEISEKRINGNHQIRASSIST